MRIPSRYVSLITGLIVLILFTACGKTSEILRIGLIKPSVDHLPFSYALQQGKLDSREIQTVYFSSGWETQEALISGNIDIAIIPFTYAWNAASKGYPVRIVSFFERETDAILVPHTHKESTLKPQSRIGLLKASSLDILFYDWAQRQSLPYIPVYFRTPNELVSAGQTREVDAIVSYEPIIQKTAQDFRVLHWFNADFPEHPCCDLVVNTTNLNPHRKRMILDLMDKLSEASLEVSQMTPELISSMAGLYGLTEKECKAALQHTTFRMGLDEAGKAFERQMISHALNLGYQDKHLPGSDIYLDLSQ